MKQLLQKMFYAFIVTAMLFSANANAQIVYTDVIPDSTINCPVINCSENYNLDLNNDANNDFILSVSYPFIGQIPAASASALNGNAVKDTSISIYNFSIPIQFNAVVDSNLLLQQSWQISGGCLSSSGNISCLWNGLSDYYLGLRLLLSGQTYYGWVRLRVAVSLGGASVIIRDYAYNSIPNQAILAGQTTATGITENSFASSINLFPNPATNQIIIDNGKLKIESVAIYDLTRRKVYNVNYHTTNANSSIRIDVSNFSAGVYAVQIKTADFIATKKLIIQK